MLIALAAFVATGLAQSKDARVAPPAGSDSLESSVVQVLRFPANSSGGQRFEDPSLTVAARSLSTVVTRTDHPNGDRGGHETTGYRDLNLASAFVLGPPQVLLLGAALLICGGILRRRRRRRQN